MSQLTKDSKLYELHTIALRHQLKIRNNEKRLEILCLDDNPDYVRECENLEPYSSSNIIVMFVKISKANDFYCKYLYALYFMDKNYVYIRILKDSTKLYHPFLKLCTFFAYCKRIWKTIQEDFIKFQADTLIFTIWNPLESDIVGFSLYKNDSLNSFPLKIIYNNESSNIITDIHEVIGYISEDYLQLQNDSNFRIMMLFPYYSKNIDEAFNGVKNIIGFASAEYCDRDFIVVVKTYFGSVDKWMDVGTFSIPNNDTLYPTCLLERISYFGWNTSSNNLYKSADSVSYCMPATVHVNSTVFDFDFAPVSNTEVYPKTLCIDNDFFMMSAVCLQNGTFQLNKELNSGCLSDLVTPETSIVYKNFVECANFKCLNMSFPFTTYGDIYIHLWNVAKADDISDFSFNLYKKGIDLLKQQANPTLHVLHFVGILMPFSYIFSKRRKNEYTVFNMSTLLIQNIDSRSNVTGIVLYEHDIYKHLTPINATAKHLLNDNRVEVMIRISHNCTNSSIVSLPLTTSIITDSYYYNTTKISKTKLVGIHNYDYVPSRYCRDTSIDIYLKLHDGTNSGYWNTVYMHPFTTIVIFIADSKTNVCESRMKWKIIQRKLISRPFKITTDSNTVNVETADIFSQLTMILNPKSSNVYVKNVFILKIIKYATSTLSIIGIICILASGVLFKRWFKMRIFSMQLCISLLIQEIFFILDTTLLNHTAYIVFYYTILTEFVWMAFIGYSQYSKFIKVFGHSELNIPKCMLVGWGLPAIITAASTVQYRYCLQCKFCAKNDEIFKYFVIIPLTILVACNLILYISVLVNIWKTEINDSEKKHRIRATVVLPFMLGVVWIVLLAFQPPWDFIILCGWYLFYMIIPSQGFVIFICFVVLHDDTRQKWLNLLNVARINK